MANTISGEAGVMQATGSNALGTGNTTDTQPQGTAEVDNQVYMRWVLDQLQRLRNFRRPYDQRRAYYYRQYIGQRDRRNYPDNITPRSNTYVPYAKSNVETVVSRVHDAFFSIDPPIEVRSRSGNGYAADAMQCVLLYCLGKAHWIKAVELFTRDLAIYGHAGMKIDWDWDYEIVDGIEPVYQMMPIMDPMTGGYQMDPLTGGPKLIPATGPDGAPIQIGARNVTKQIPRNCPKFIPIDIYDLLIDPDEKIKAHVMEISWGELKRAYQANPQLYFPEAMANLERQLSQYKDLDREGIIIRFAEVWDDTNKQVSQVTFGEDADTIGWKDRRYQYRAASYSAYKRRVYNGPPQLLYRGPNPFKHQRIPILDMGYIKVKGDVFGIGLIETISDLNEGVNVFVNMITDNWNMGINRRFAYDVQVDIDHDQLDMGNVPGGKVAVTGDPSKAIFPLPSFTPNQGDYAIIDLYRGMIEMASGISDFYAKGVGASGGNRTASGIGQVIAESGYVFKLLIRNIELELLQPLMMMSASMIQQFGTDEMEWSLTCAPPQIPKYGSVKLEDLAGGYDFDFLAANYATGEVVKQRNLMAFYNIAMQSPYANQGEFIKEIARAMRIPNLGRLLKSDQQVMQEQQAAMQNQRNAAVLDKLLDFESKAVIKQLGKTEPNIVTKHGLSVQEVVENYLAETGNFPIQAHPPQTSRHEGAAPTGQPEGQMPGGGDVADMMRGFAQSNGANALGTAGT